MVWKDFIISETERMEVPDSRVTDERAGKFCSPPSPIPFDCEHKHDEGDEDQKR